MFGSSAISRRYWLYREIVTVVALAVVFSCQSVDRPAEKQKALAQAKKDSKWSLAPGKSSGLSEQRRAELTRQAMAQIPPETEGADRTLSPYFFVLSDDPTVDQLPLKSTSAQVDIAGVIANVKVIQVYENTGASTLEAIYIFPASTRAAVYAMRMTIGERVIEAKIKEREQARQEYEQARAEGKTASLLEQQRPNVFQMNVANILPNDLIKVEMFYTELLVPEDNVYEFVYPTAVGPRYSNQPSQGAPEQERFSQNPTLPAGADVPYDFDMDVEVRGGVPIAEIISPSHKIKVDSVDDTTRRVALQDKKNAGNRDFILRYRLAGDKIQSGVLLYPGREENFFLLMMEPPERIDSSAVVPREYIFIMDVSGSMHGFPLETSKALMLRLLSGLRPTDSFNAMAFSGGSALLSETSLPAMRANIERTRTFIEQMEGGGGTEIVPALQRALQLPRTSGVSRTIVIATDGYVTVEKECFELIRRHLGDANLFAFGIGSSVNRYIIEGMARAGMGEPFIVSDPAHAEQQADQLTRIISSPLLQGIQVDFDGFDAYDVEPASIPDLFAQKPVIVFGKYRGGARGTIKVKGHVPNQTLEGVMPLAEANLSDQNTALRYLWARHRIIDLADLNKLDKTDARVKEVTELGLKYSLMTEYTSFVAVDLLARAEGKNAVTVKQPLPMPQNVSNLAVGGLSALGAVGTGRWGGGGAGAFVVAPKISMPVGDALLANGYSIGDARGRGGLGKAMEKRAPMRSEHLKAVEPAQVSGAKSWPSVNIASLVVQGARKTEQVKAAIVSRLAIISRCYKAVLAVSPNLSGAIRIELVIDKDGKVSGIKVLSSTANNDSLEACLVRALRAMTFPKPIKGITRVALSLDFAPGK